MGTPTTNFGWILPTVQGDPDDWGDFLNSNLTLQDAFLRSFMNTFKSNTAPAFAALQAGTMWIDDTLNPWTWSVYDGTSWVTIGTIDSSTHIFVPSNASGDGFVVGDLKQSSIASNHGKWLICDGSALNRVTYSALDAVYSSQGYPFGDGDGSTTFNIPDMRGRVGGAIGAGPGLSVRAIGTNVGEETHTLTQAEIPDYLLQGSVVVANSGGANVRGSFTGTGVSNYDVRTGGSGTPFNVMQPTLFAGNYFVFTGV